MCIRPISWEDPLEEMATHSSILVWETPWIEEPTVPGIAELDTNECIHACTKEVSQAERVLFPKDLFHNSQILLLLILYLIWPLWGRSSLKWQMSPRIINGKFYFQPHSSSLCVRQNKRPVIKRIE